jgi:hypothetical protein
MHNNDVRIHILQILPIGGQGLTLAEAYEAMAARGYGGSEENLRENFVSMSDVEVIKPEHPLGYKRYRIADRDGEEKKVKVRPVGVIPTKRCANGIEWILATEAS